MKLYLIALSLIVLPLMASAEWALLDSDRVLTRVEVEDLTAGNTLVFYDDGRSTYAADGAYSYTYASGASAVGRYRIEADGTVCIRYPNGFGRCDRYVRNGSRIVLLTETGLRFPVRPRPEEK